MTVAFFGHGDAPRDIEPRLEQVVVRLIEENERITFLVGTHGTFDLMAQSVLGQALERYPGIICHIVLAYIPVDGSVERYALPTLVPDGIENASKRFAISYRNDYMVKECDTVICYITHDWGGAAQFVEKAERAGKMIINIAENTV